MVATSRIWIDTDAACGQGKHIDPDDCLALLLLAKAPDLEIAGISSVFGNSSLQVTDRTARELVDVLKAEGANLPSVNRGAATPGPAHALTDAALALQAALAKSQLTIVALGPLTNVAAALEGRIDLHPRVTTVIAVMGRRTGHWFHPTEGSGSGTLFGHGPVFRDFNFAKDPRAAAAILRMNLPVVFVPYEAARHVEISERWLNQLSADGPGSSWVAARCRDWLAYWRQDIGRDGFCPFDAVAAAYVRDPSQLLCAEVTAWVGVDPTTFVPFWDPPALLVAQSREHIKDPQVVGHARYCVSTIEQFDRNLRRWLTGALDIP
jgi:inosine-uridine nucleoside N-ribohydrolase